jgi:Tol biopolymer transport system component
MRYGSAVRIRASGGNPDPLGVTAPGPAHPAISSSGKRLALHSSFTDSNICQYQRAGLKTGSTPAAFESSRCVVCSTVVDREPRYSPDGRKIVFASPHSGSDETWDGGYPIQLTSAGRLFTGAPH